MGTSKNALFPRWLRQLGARRPKAAMLGPTFLMYRPIRYGSPRGGYAGFALDLRASLWLLSPLRYDSLFSRKKSLFFEVPK